MEWIESEFATLDLADARRDARVKSLVGQFARMAESQPDACMNDADLAALYRVANNPDIAPGAILEAHHQAAIRRTASHDVVVLAQDTTLVDLTKPNRQVKGAGPLESDDKLGFFLHPLYAISQEGIPLGVVDDVVWAREGIRTDLSRAEKERLRKQMCFEEKESSRWLEMLQSGEQIARANPQTHYINLADSESDIHELFIETNDQANNHDFIFRCCQNRALVAANGQPANVDEALAGCEILAESEAFISERVSKIAGETRPRRKSRSARVARISIRSVCVNVRGPSRAGGRLPDVQLNVVEAIELDPPEGEEPIRWVLFTSLPIETAAQAERVIRLYSLRWNVELFFKTLKSGLGIEKLKYQTLDRYLTAVAMLLVVAWRVEQIKVAARVDGDASCEDYFEPSEWKPTYMVANKSRKLPEIPPTMAEFVLILAKLGGYVNKKGQGPPGSKIIWRGLRRLEAYRDAYLAFGIG
ncbi:IS4 family transposase [Roseimaritima sediminicola]|uniref:IS4 family transposase n=1 Tax=Roseimaritima sediminicola TaxID=2662066 RepID=UPI0012984AB8|nr:IS4 family transposase [Roseimaritima sediminicola]